MGPELVASGVQSSACIHPILIERQGAFPGRPLGTEPSGHSARKYNHQDLGWGHPGLIHIGSDPSQGSKARQEGCCFLSASRLQADRSASSLAALTLSPSTARPSPVCPQAHQMMSVPHSSYNNTFIRRETDSRSRGKAEEAEEINNRE